jgi:regulator of sigma E protease
VDLFLSGLGLSDSFSALMPLAALDLLDLSFWTSALQVAIGLGFVIFVHELGHFLVAKACGVKCEKFYVGFDFFDLKIGNVVILPRALFKYQWGETEYGLGIIPLGGYVKMLGQDDNPANAEREAERTRVYQDGDVPNAGQEGDEAHIPSGDLPPEPTSDTAPAYELDPRSYTAKSVPQRMAIISAGVIMNLIFAVIFAAIAHWPGVEYTPTVVGGVQPGSPAYVAGLRPGDQIIRLNNGERSLEHRFDRDLRLAVGLSAGEKVPVTIGRGEGSGGKEFAEEIDLVLVPEQNDPDQQFATIGVLPVADSKLASEMPASPSHPKTLEAGFQGGDRIVGAKIGDETIEPKNGVEFQRFLANHPEATVEVTVARAPEDASADAKPDEKVISLPPSSAKTLGIVMKMMPVDSVQKGSPADAAAIQAGDRLLKWNGEPIRDPRSLDEAALAFAREQPGESATLEIERKGKPVEISIVPRLRTQSFEQVGRGQPLGVDTLGIAVPVDQEVVSIDPEGPAAKIDLKPGDRITAIDFVVDEAKKKEYEDTYHYRFEKRDLAAKNSWGSVDALVQDQMPPGVALKLTRTRGEASADVTIEPQTVPDRYLADRGLNFVALQRLRVATGPVDAVRLGLRETWEGAYMVAFTLKKLFTGEVSVTALGGPLTIVAAAKSQADVSSARFLIFLTLLSANLAVMNFLPIPVLDGGHMMFLIFEGLRGKPLNEKWQMGLTVAGLFMVMGLMVFVMGLDLTRFLPMLFS